MTSSPESRPVAEREESPAGKAEGRARKSDMLQASYLNDLRKQRMSVIVYLMSGVKQAGMIESFDQHAVMLRFGAAIQLIYKHTIASIVPAAKAISSTTSPRLRKGGNRPDSTTTPVIKRKTPRRILTVEE